MYSNNANLVMEEASLKGSIVFCPFFFLMFIFERERERERAHEEKRGLQRKRRTEGPKQALC